MKRFKDMGVRMAGRPKSKVPIHSKTFTMRMKPEDHNMLMELARAKKKEASWLLRDHIKRAFKRMKRS